MAVKSLSVDAWPSWDDPSFYDNEPDVIHAAMAAQRRADPVHWYEPGGFWVLSKWEHQRFVSTHPELFTSRFGFLVGDASDPGTAMGQLPSWAQEQLVQPGLTRAEQRGIIARAKVSMGDPNMEALLYLDPPRHQEVRAIMMRALTPRLVRGLRPLIEQLTDDALDNVKADVVTDFVHTVAEPIPAGIMAELIGVPREMRAQFTEWSAAVLASATITPDKDRDEAARLARLSAEFLEYVDDLVEERRATGGEGDDLVSVIIRSELDGAPVSRIMGLMYITILIGAGSDTTAHLLAFFAHAMVEHPEQLKMLLETPDLLPSAIEETLRYYPIVWSECRSATQRIELGDKVINKDDFVVMSYSSANRDEDVWHNPDKYDITRPFKKGHLAFGWGEHVCPGAALSRMDAAIVFERLLSRFASWEAAEAPARLTSPFLNGLVTLPLTFHK